MTWLLFLAIPVIAGALIWYRRRPFAPGKGWRHYGNFDGMKQTGMPAPNFTFGEPHYMTKDCGGGAGVVRVRYRITGSNFEALEGGRPEPRAPTLSLHFQRRGDDWSASGKYAGYRWYSRQEWPVEAGEREIVMSLDPQYWIPVVASGQGFEEALRDASRVGLTFGHAGGRGHGVRGTGTFQLISFEVT